MANFKKKRRKRLSKRKKDKMVPFGSLKRAKRLAREEFGSPPPTKVEKDKKKYSRKVKHKEKL